MREALLVLFALALDPLTQSQNAGDHEAAGIAPGRSPIHSQGALVTPVQLSFPPDTAGYVTQFMPAAKGFSIGFSTYLGGNSDGMVSLALAKGPAWLAGIAAASLLVPDAGLGIGFLARLVLAPPPGVPLIRTVSNAASFDPGDVISPGELVTLIGAEFSATVASAQGSPLPATLAGVSVTVGGIAAPLIYLSPTQINFQVPYNVPQSDVPIVVQRGSQANASRTVGVNPVTPGIFLNADANAPWLLMLPITAW